MKNFYRGRIQSRHLVPMLTAEFRMVDPSGREGEPSYLTWRGESPSHGQVKETLIAHGAGGVNQPAPMPTKDLEFFKAFLRSWYAGPCVDGTVEVLADVSKIK